MTWCLEAIWLNWPGKYISYFQKTVFKALSLFFIAKHPEDLQICCEKGFGAFCHKMFPSFLVNIRCIKNTNNEKNSFRRVRHISSATQNTSVRVTVTVPVTVTVTRGSYSSAQWNKLNSTTPKLWSLNLLLK